MTRAPRKPVAFEVNEEGVAIVREGEATPAGARIVVTPEPELEPDAPLPVVPRRRGLPLGRIFWTALGGLVSLGVGLSIDALVRDLFARNDWLGWTGLVLAVLALVAAVAIIVREVVGVARVRRIDVLRERAVLAAAKDEPDEALAVSKELVTLYRDRADTARGRRALAGHLREVIDGRDLLVLTEHELMRPLDAAARTLVADAAKRVSVVTAVSPRAVVDVLFVLVAVLGLIRKLADLYGGRPGFFGFLSLTRQVIGHLAVTGGMAVGDSLIQQIVGHGVAARLSARLGEGVINGLLTARIGLAAIDVCRPLPFLAQPRPGVGDVMSGVMGKGAKVEE
ncbi:YcjF family protein [Chthonobacter albigriseus]|uniref:YcjF family protein n=1 Tax=Chthonobacter albigriseus TaxID=1683161 RepID=UPI0015EFA532|nr:TIGR01620 family protein [Chthonobacter albigriseus]